MLARYIYVCVCVGSPLAYIILELWSLGTFIGEAWSYTTMSIVEVRVPNLDCEGCASKLKKALSKLKGVEKVEVEMEIQKIIVKGYALEEKKVVKAIKKAGKAAEPWPFPGYSHFASFYKYPTYIVNHYYDTYKNETTTGVHTFFHTPSVYSVAVASDEAIASLFSDDNPHACAIM